jgi:hypothetical protein
MFLLAVVHKKDVMIDEESLQTVLKNTVVCYENKKERKKSMTSTHFLWHTVLQSESCTTT